MSLLTTPFPADATADEVLDGVDLTGRHMLVTGGASGLGAATVRALALAGASVTIATRDPRAAKPLLDELPRVDAAALDLADPTSVRAFVAQWHRPLDALLANAGVMALPTRQVSSLGWELQLATNFLGHFQLITGLQEHLTAAAPSRVVLVSSGIQLRSGVDFDDPQFERRPYDPWAAYAQSKTADALLAVAISQRWSDLGVTANACSPGTIHTKLQRHMDSALLRAMGAMDDDGNLVPLDSYKTPEQGAATTVLLAASPLLEGVTGRYFEDNQEAAVVPGGPDVERGVAEWSVDPVAADRLWDLAVSAG